jgi:hypothetical protein
LPHIATSALQPGDLVFFGGIGHFAMYVGNGYIIDAPQTGMSVQKTAMSGWYASAYVGAARLQHPRGPAPVDSSGASGGPRVQVLHKSASRRFLIDASLLEGRVLVT